jgi:hypothetical protein
MAQDCHLEMQVSEIRRSRELNPKRMQGIP